MVFEHREQYESQWAAITSIAEKIGCAAETLRSWVRQAERDFGKRPGLTTDERARLLQAGHEPRTAARCREAARSLWRVAVPAGGPAVVVARRAFGRRQRGSASPPRERRGRRGAPPDPRTPTRTPTGPAFRAAP
jgi:hypothetical protein